MLKNDLITIGILCFNAENTILRALKGAVEQTWKNIEIVIVDDSSTDQSAQIIADFIKEHPDVRQIRHEENRGASASRQTLINHAKGDFIAFFDDDDVSLPERLKTQHEKILSYEQLTGATLIACYASGKRLYPNGYEIDIQAIGSKPQIPVGVAVANRLLFYGGHSDHFYGAGTPTCSLMARKNTFEYIGGFDPALRRVEDVDFAIRLALASGHFIGCPEKLFIQYATDTTDKSPEKNYAAEIQLTEKYKDYLISVKRYYYAKKWPLLRYYHFKKEYGRMLMILLQLFIRHPVKTTSHFLATAPKRFLHERKMKKGRYYAHHDCMQSH